MDSIYIFLDQHPWISILIIGIFQLWAFSSTVKKLRKYKDFFPSIGKWTADTDGNAYRIAAPAVSDDAKELVTEINEYLAKNEGTTDFGIIKDKTERRLDSMYEDAMSKVSFPTYLGLFGTFFGVWIGLECFNIGIATSGITDQNVSELIGGIIVSMFTSLVGLILMMAGNWIASSVQKKVEADKNEFYDFIQVELMPVLGTSMVSALNKLHSTINTFEPAFRSVINDFKAAFGECTETLRDTFGEKVTVLTHAVDTMGRNMSLVNENVKRQDELLKTLHQRQTITTLEKFTEAADKFDSVTMSITRLNEIKDNIATSSNALVRAQTEFVEQMSIPERVFEKVNAILSRITTFEDSINALGSDIAQTQLLGNMQMNLIQEQITAIQKKTDMAVSYQEIADDELERLFSAQSNAIQSLSARYNAAISQHGEDFETTMNNFRNDFERIVNECRQAVEDKRNEYIDEIRKSIDLEANNQHLAKLDKIDEIRSDLSGIKTSVEKQDTLLSGIHTSVKQQNIPDKLDELKAQLADIKKLAVSSGGKNGANGESESKPRGIFSVFGRHN